MVVKPGAKQVIPPREPLEIKAQRRTSEHQPVTQEIAGSNPVAPAKSSALDLHRSRDPHVSALGPRSSVSPPVVPRCASVSPSSPRRNWTEIVPRLNLPAWSITASAHLRKHWLFSHHSQRIPVCPPTGTGTPPSKRNIGAT